jgi:carbonic anhydrase
MKSEPWTDRRGLLRGLGCCTGAAGLAVLGATGAAAETAKAAAQTGEAGSGLIDKPLTPDEALELLKAGNRDFLTDSPVRRAEGRERRLQIAAGQKPFAVLVGCSDSRVSPELLFGRGLGELFIIRVAGNTVDVAAHGSVEYAISQLDVPLVVVLGHERCGAVHAALDVVEKNAQFPGQIGDMIEPIIPAVLRARSEAGEGASEDDLLQQAVIENVKRVVEDLKASGPLIQEPLAAGKLKIVGAHYDLEEGTVEFLEA